MGWSGRKSSALAVSNQRNRGSNREATASGAKQSEGLRFELGAFTLTSGVVSSDARRLGVKMPVPGEGNAEAE
jgi:hypothetical protein